MMYASFVHPFLHEVLPITITRVVFLDVGDVLVMGDVADLWQEFERFRPKALAAVAIEGGWSHLERERRWRISKEPQRTLKLRAASGTNYSWAQILNPAGISLWNLERARARNWTSVVLTTVRRIGTEGCTGGGCMTVVTQVFRRRPDLWHELSSAWHFYPETPWDRPWNVKQLQYESTGHHWPFALRDRRLPYGLLDSAPLVMENPCPPLPVLLATFVLPSWIGGDKLHIKRARTMGRRYVQFMNNRFFSSDMRCGTLIRALHASGPNKHERWAQELFALWGQAPREASAEDVVK